MEKIKFSYKLQIEQINNEGFVGILKEGYLVKFKDSKFIYPFKKGDLLEITLENVEEFRREEINEIKSILYIKLHSFISNGFLFQDYTYQTNFFWQNRGILTHKKFEHDNIFQENDIIKITIKKLFKNSQFL